MDKLTFGNHTVAADVFSAREQVGGRSVPALEIRLAQPLTQEEAAAVTSGEVTILDESGAAVLGVYSGYTTLMRHTVVLAKVTTAELELAETRSTLAQAQTQAAELEAENAALLYQNLTGEELTNE